MCEPHRTPSERMILERARCVEVCHISLGWFQHISSGWFKHIEPHRTYTNHIITEIARCVEVYHMSSGWFDCTEPSLCTLLQGKQGVQGAYAIVPCTPCFSSKYVDRGGSVESNQLEPML